MSPTDTLVLEAAPKTKPEFVIMEPLNHNRWSLYRMERLLAGQCLLKISEEKTRERREAVCIRRLQYAR